MSIYSPLTNQQLTLTLPFSLLKITFRSSSAKPMNKGLSVVYRYPNHHITFFRLRSGKSAPDGASCLTNKRAREMHRVPYPSQGFAGFCLIHSASQSPAVAALSGSQDCGKKDPFSPQARWGDDGARQVKRRHCHTATHHGAFIQTDSPLRVEQKAPT